MTSREIMSEIYGPFVLGRPKFVGLTAAFDEMSKNAGEAAASMSLFNLAYHGYKIINKRGRNKLVRVR